MTDTTRLARTLEAIDAANAADPHQESFEGKSAPKEWLYGRRMSETLALLEPSASEALQLAVRSQHIRRWEVPRDSYPMDRPGYLRWRKDLQDFHSEQATAILEAEGYSAEEIGRVTDLLHKRKFKVDPEAQTLEDVACLVFLRYYLDEFMRQHPEEKVVEIIAKTWKKMSEKGHQAALKLPLSAEAGRVVQKALA
ncbi:protein of unknown function [Catalinimonas alkaloidigena]|uniref:DUF4202 domain-containing protein n=1 Tax=Catalinimonas alkaloidigena TaxID=1075417 RepID=A0A1G9R6D0_9BACT|nr:DUF4202 domain-containing protein [Catalinimonas alkaloidigena]SDM18856.1 protein of unknown function [Catalinimonas alkaloidigena]